MEISKLKLEFYDLAAIILPGMFLLAEIFALTNGFPQLVLYIHSITGVHLSLILLCSFAVGNLVQEAGDRLVKRLTGKRFFRKGRDEFWKSTLKNDVCAKIAQLGGPSDISVDAAFDYCLTYLSGGFAKRDVFLAISDLSRSLWLLSLIGIFPLIRETLSMPSRRAQAILAAEGVAALVLTAYLSWSRMVRFREVSESPVFHSFLAHTADKDKLATEPEKGNGE